MGKRQIPELRAYEDAGIHGGAAVEGRCGYKMGENKKNDMLQNTNSENRHDATR